MAEKPVIANNTPLVAFWAIGRLDVLHALFGEISISPAVRDEFLALEAASREQTLEENRWIRVVPLKQPARVRMLAGLDAGEAETLVLAEELDARLVLMDERKGRRYAERLGLPVTGTMGVLLLAKEEGVIERIAPVLRAIEENGLFIGNELKQKVLALAGETDA